VFSGIGLAAAGDEVEASQSSEPPETTADKVASGSSELHDPAAVATPPTLEDLDMGGLQSALDEAIELPVAVPPPSAERRSHDDTGSSDCGTRHERLFWNKTRIWREEDDVWVGLTWTIRAGYLFALTATSPGNCTPNSLPDALLSELLERSDPGLVPEAGGQQHRNTKASVKTGTPRYLFYDGASDGLVVTQGWQEGARDATIVAGATDLRNVMLQFPDISEVSARTTNNKWILGKTRGLGKRSDPPNEVYLTVDRKDASLVDADYDLRFFLKTHPECSASAAS